SEIDPLRLSSALLAQTTLSLPALAVGAGVKFMVISSETSLQSLFPVVVKVKVTDSLAISVAVGVYVVVKLFALAKVPFPPDHVPPSAIVTTPAKETTALFAQSV